MEDGSSEAENTRWGLAMGKEPEIRASGGGWAQPLARLQALTLKSRRQIFEPRAAEGTCADFDRVTIDNW
ncbi:hypothetical protein ACVIGV_006771 [Rhizobium leguminosarum]|nr:hypothetical protein [Rhizobium leguminosarum]